MKVTTQEKKQFYQIIKQELIYPVYQPIVSLVNGEIVGYEALSRIQLDQCEFNTEEMFHISEVLGQVWELEAICRKKSLQCARQKPLGAKLFLNVDPNVIHDEKFQSGTTVRYLEQYNMKPSDIIFEITERSSIEDCPTFCKTIQHYKKQRFEIAIDDFGNGYAGLARVCAFSPDYLKIDMEVVRNIDSDRVKQSLVESFALFCESEQIKLIAEGIETKEELQKLIEIGVEYGQGYYLQKPDRNMYDLKPEQKLEIRNLHLKHERYKFQPSFFGAVETICHEGQVTFTDQSALEVYERFAKNKDLTEICVIDRKKNVVGYLTKTMVMELFGGRFGYELHAKRNVEEIMRQKFLFVDVHTPIETVSKMALARPVEDIYDAVIITVQGKYRGVVTVKDLLEAAISIQVARASEASPLTGLPGNAAIQEKIEMLLTNELPYSVIYIDMDNFKAYNDAYGFNNGDLMIKSLAKVLENHCGENRFVGHIGGDDFVVITHDWNTEKLYRDICRDFDMTIQSLYSKTDWNRGFIISKDRNGFENKFPITTLSVAAVTNEKQNHESVDAFSKEIAKLKKEAKKVVGNSYVLGLE